MNRAKLRHRVRQRNARSDRKRAVLGAPADIVQPSDPAEPNHALQVAQLLGDPEPNVGCPAHEGRVGKARIQRRQRIETRGRREEGGLVANKYIPVVSELGKRRSAFARRRRESVGRRAVARLQRRREDRTIAGASAEISRELVAKPRISHRVIGLVGGEQAHHDPGRAKATLRGVSIDHRLLQRMEFATGGKVLDRDQFSALELAQEQNTGVERLVGEPTTPESRQHNRACAAIPFGAAFLRSLRSHLLSEPIKDGRARVELAENNLRVPKTKAQRVARAGWPGLKRHRRSLTPAIWSFCGQNGRRQSPCRKAALIAPTVLSKSRARKTAADDTEGKT